MPMGLVRHSHIFFFFFFFFFFLLSTCPSVLSESSDVLLLLTKIKPSLQGSSDSNQQLSSWNSSTPLCQWRGLRWSFADGSPLLCEDPRHRTNLSFSRDPSLQLFSLQLPASGLSGCIPREIGELSSLQSLFLGVNSLVGAIPMELGNCPALAVVDLGGNRLEGPVPPSMWNLCDRLVSLRLHGNGLTGPLPDPAMPNVTCEHLRSLDLNGNGLRGPFPAFVTNFAGLRQLDLGGNRFSGSIPASLAELRDLQRLNLSYNNFTGPLPVFHGRRFGAESFEGNSRGLCGDPLRGCPGSSGALSSGGVAGLVIGLMAGAVVLASLAIGYLQRRRRRGRGSGASDEEDVVGEEEVGGGGGREGKLVVFQGGEHLTLEDVLNATGQVLEKTSYGTVYKARLADGGVIALWLLREGSCKDRASCLPIIRQLARARHENLVPLRAFYEGQRGEKLLIYDYLPNRSLHELLHGSRAGRPQLNWARRHKIALGVARGLAYLHKGNDAPITHGNVRARNVVVDEFFMPRVTEYGLDKMMVPAVTDEMMAEAKADGYKAPELQKMKRSSARTDVYSFGILLLEILMGRKPGRDVGSGETLDLPALVKAAVLEETTMEVFDAEVLKSVRSPMEEGLVHTLKLAMGCCAPVADVRPDMSEVVKQLEENRPRNRSALYSPTETRSEIGTPF